MATFKSEFQDLAAELIDGEFADFRRPLVITQPGVFDPVTETFTGGASVTVQAIRQRFNYFEYLRSAIGSGGIDIQVTDFAVVYTATGTAPSVNQQVTYDGKACQVVDVMQDAADAAIKLILRAL